VLVPPSALASMMAARSVQAPDGLEAQRPSPGLASGSSAVLVTVNADAAWAVVTGPPAGGAASVTTRMAASATRQSILITGGGLSATEAWRPQPRARQVRSARSILPQPSTQGRRSTVQEGIGGCPAIAGMSVPSDRAWRGHDARRSREQLTIGRGESLTVGRRSLGRLRALTHPCACCCTGPTTSRAGRSPRACRWRSVRRHRLRVEHPVDYPAGHHDV
jgi:hypothetical protein